MKVTNPISAQMLSKNLREVSDFPKKGIQFLDMSPVLADPQCFQAVIEQMASPFMNQGVTKIVAIESRGFILGAAMAQKMNVGFVMVRKKGKMPGPTKSISYTLEYGVDQLEIYAQAVAPGEKILIVDDVLATGGTAQATQELCESIGAEVIGTTFFIEISFLEGRHKLKGAVYSVLQK